MKIHSCKNIEATVFVYQQTSKPYRHKCVYLDDPKPGDGWKHTATIDPAMWIQYFMNNPRERERQIEDLSY